MPVTIADAGTTGFQSGNALILLIAGLAAFICLHTFRELGWRETLVQRVGLTRYRLGVSAGIVISLLLIVLGKSSAGFVQIWVPAFTMRELTHLLMISSCILFSAGLLPSSHTRALVGHPMLTGTFIWGAAHLASNGDLASMLLFGSLACWSLFKIVSLEYRNRSARQQRTPSPALQWDAAAILLGMIAYAAFLVFHGHLFGFALTGPV